MKKSFAVEHLFKYLHTVFQDGYYMTQIFNLKKKCRALVTVSYKFYFFHKLNNNKRQIALYQKINLLENIFTYNCYNNNTNL